jgi:hypothetical protein
MVNTVAYADEVVGFARVNSKFLATVEKAFADFVTSAKKTQVLPHMPIERRKFVHDVSFFLPSILLINDHLYSVLSSRAITDSMRDLSIKNHTEVFKYSVGSIHVSLPLCFRVHCKHRYPT